MRRLEGQVAVVTGGATGLGGAISRKFAAEGASVLIADMDEETASSTAEEIKAEDGVVDVIRADVSVHDDIRGMIERAAGQWGRLDILVNNAFSAMAVVRGGAEEITEEEWDLGMAVLVKAMFLGAKYAVPEMRKSGGGSIVNMSSVHGLLVAEDWLIYETGKTAVIGLTRQMACQYGPDSIRVNAICPGHIVTENIQAAMWEDNPGGLRLFENAYPLRRAGKPVEIANAALFLCSGESSFVTGHALVVDGGLTVQVQENLGVRQARFMQSQPDTKLPY